MVMQYIVYILIIFYIVHVEQCYVFMEYKLTLKCTVDFKLHM